MRSTIGLDALIDRARADGVQTLVLADYNALYGVVQFDRACRKAGIRPIIGLTLSVQSPLGAPGSADVLLLARNHAGYQTLCRLSTAVQAHADREQRIASGLPWRQLVREGRQHLIAIDAGRRGWAAKNLLAGDLTSAQVFASEFHAIFGRNAYLGLEIQPSPRLQALPEMTAKVSKTVRVPMVALQPVYCLDADERDTLHLLAAIEQNTPRTRVSDRTLVDGGDRLIDLHWLSSAEMQTRFADYPKGLANIDKILASCAFELPTGTPVWPQLDLPSGVAPDDQLVQDAQAGLTRRYGISAETHQPRLQHELDSIRRHGFAPFFLVVADIVRFARASAVPISTRGSVANSLVAYCLGISTVDPMEHDLLFERFLNPARKSLPDIDLDFCSRRRDQVLNYVRDKYGAEHVSLVATINTLQRKSAVRETAKALGHDEAAIKRLTAMLPSRWHPDPRRRDKRTLAEFAQSLDSVAERQIFATAAKLIGQPNHLSVHPGGVVITPTALTDFVPLQWSPKGFLITQFDHSDVEQVGLPKLDLLGIRALTVLADSAEWVQENVDPNFNLDHIPLDDSATAHAIATGNTVAVFQCESHGAQRTQRKLNARTVRDLAVANAFFKPGPATGGMANAFVNRYRGEESVSYLHPKLEPILSPTKGILLFQEQILRVATEVAGLNWTQANQIRKGMSKFQAAAMQALQAQFVAGCQQASIGMSHAQAETLWQQVYAFAGYGFNQGHATAYADISYRSAWMKTHYPAPFLTARLAHGGGYYHPAVYVAEARKNRIQVEPPHVNHSQRRFSLELIDGDPVLWMGLGWVRDVRRQTVKELIAGRPFADLSDLLQRVAVQKKELLHLIQCGALDGLADNRAVLLEQMTREFGVRQQGQMMMLFGEDGENSAETPTIPPPTAQQKLAWETHLLGFPVSVHPVETLDTLPDAIVPLHEIDRYLDQTVTIAGCRLPSWDNSGFLFSDRTSYVRAVFPKSRRDTMRKPKRWQPAILTGQWRRDRFGNHAFVVTDMVV